MLRNLLILLRDMYSNDLKRTLTVGGITAAVCIVLSLLLDSTLPFTGVSNILRSILLLPLSASLFVLGYMYSLYLHYRKMNSEEPWQPYRLRFSPRYRRYMAAIGASILVVMMYSVGKSVGYTLMSSVFVALGVALLAFIRLTKEEALREELEIPDARDVKLDYRKKLADEAKALKKSKKKGSKDELD